MDGETVRYRTRLHWIFFIWPILWLVIAIILLKGPDAAKPVGAIIGVFSSLWMFHRIIVYITSEFAVSDKRVLFKVGFIRRNSIEILLSKMEMISVNQSILGRILGFGTVVIGGTGGSKNRFANIAAPMELRLNVQQQADIVQG